jgi:hypothetical protein
MSLTDTLAEQGALENTARGAHLCGSLPVPDAATAFQVAARTLGPWLRRMPDGETGPRSIWARAQAAMFACHPAFTGNGRAGFRLARGIAEPGQLSFGPLGYASVARQSYGVFRALKRDGVIPHRMRFQVSLPTPLAVVTLLLDGSCRDQVLDPYERAMLAEVRALCACVPGHELAIQWDTAVEFFRYIKDSPDPHCDEIVERLRRLGDAVPPGVELGYHLCYGDPMRPGHRDASDATPLVKVANALLAALARPPTWLHMPVPLLLVELSWLAPLARLMLPEETELYLGVVEPWGQLTTMRRKVAAASRVCGRFGVASPCGLGRVAAFGKPTRDLLPSLLAWHAELSQPLVTAGGGQR